MKSQHLLSQEKLEPELTLMGEGYCSDFRDRRYDRYVEFKKERHN